MKRKVPSNLNLSTVTNYILLKIVYFNVNDDEHYMYKVQIEHMDNVLFTSIIRASKDPITEELEAKIVYDPRNAKEISNLVSQPVVIKLMKSLQERKQRQSSAGFRQSRVRIRKESLVPSKIYVKSLASARLSEQFGMPSECIIDILPFFMGQLNALVEKRFEPTYTETIFIQKSWENLPIIKLRIQSFKNETLANADRELEFCRVMDLKMIALIAEDDLVHLQKLNYSANSVTLTRDKGLQSIAFGQCVHDKTFGELSEYHKWAPLQNSGKRVVESDLKVDFHINKFRSPLYQYNECLDILKDITPAKKCIEWTSFYRSLIYRQDVESISTIFRKYLWPFSVTISDYTSVYLTGFANFFDLLRPGVTKVSTLVGMTKVDNAVIRKMSGIDGNIFGNKEKSGSPALGKRNEAEPAWYSQVVNGNIFIFVEIELSKPLKEVVIERPLDSSALDNTQNNFFKAHLNKLKNKSQIVTKGLSSQWSEAVERIAASISALSPMKYLDVCSLVYGMSCTRSWVEFSTAISKAAKSFIYENFPIRNYMQFEEKYKHLIKSAHIVLMREAYCTLYGISTRAIKDKEINERELKAARNVRKYNHFQKFVNIFARCLIRDWNNSALWRELGTALRSSCRLSSEVCLHHAWSLEPMNALNLLALGTLLSESHLIKAEPFFAALYMIHPFWLPGLVCVYCYYSQRELFSVSDNILTELADPGREYYSTIDSYAALDNWWSPVGVTVYNDIFLYTAYLLLQIGALDMAETCLSRVFILKGESPLYCHLKAVSSALRGDLKTAVCLCRKALEKYGEVVYIEKLIAQCSNIMEGNNDQLALSLDEAILLAQERPSAFHWSNVARLLSISGRFKEAETVAAYALSLDRFEGTAWREMAMAVRGHPPPADKRFSYYCAKASSLGCPVSFIFLSKTVIFDEKYECCECVSDYEVEVANDTLE